MKEVFSEWRETKENDEGLALVVKSGKLRIEVLNKIDASCSERIIFLGEIKKPTMRVGFLNAFLSRIYSSDPKEIQVPVLSRLEVEKVGEYFQMRENLKKRINKLDCLIELKLFKIVNKTRINISI